MVAKHTTHGLYVVLVTLLVRLFLSGPQAYASPVLDTSITPSPYLHFNASADLTKRFRGDVTPRNPGLEGPENLSDYPHTSDIQDAVRPTLGTIFVFWTEVPNGEGSDRAEQFAQQVGGVYIDNAFPHNYV